MQTFHAAGGRIMDAPLWNDTEEWFRSAFDWAATQSHGKTAAPTPILNRPQNVPMSSR
jgi:hypothetical protein